MLLGWNYVEEDGLPDIDKTCIFETGKYRFVGCVKVEYANENKSFHWVTTYEHVNFEVSKSDRWYYLDDIIDDLNYNEEFYWHNDYIKNLLDSGFYDSPCPCI